VRFAFVFAGFKQGSPGFLGDPQGCPRQSAADYFNSLSTTTSTLVLDNTVRRPATSFRGCTGSTSTTVRCCNIVSRPHQLIVDYFIYLSRLVSTSKLVEHGCYALNN
jgi:hypothetical protein